MGFEPTIFGIVVRITDHRNRPYNPYYLAVTMPDNMDDINIFYINIYLVVL